MDAIKKWVSDALKMPPFTYAQIEAIAKALSETDPQYGFTGSEIRQYMRESGVKLASNESTKWKFLRDSLLANQREVRGPSGIIGFLMTAMAPERHVRNEPRYEHIRQNLNEVLAFTTFQIGASGTIQIVPNRATTIGEAARRAQELRRGLSTRGVHPEVLKHCREELLNEDYFHAVFSAAKSISETIRNRTGLTGDGAQLFQAAFGVSDPYLAINALTTESERSEQKGFVNLLNGIFGMFRHPRAHEVRAKWKTNEADAEEALALISYAHKRLDQAVAVPGRCLT
jgi:uncharacterized protein (TIGR02391 family)